MKITQAQMEGNVSESESESEGGKLLLEVAVLLIAFFSAISVLAYMW